MFPIGREREGAPVGDQALPAGFQIVTVGAQQVFPILRRAQALMRVLPVRVLRGRSYLA